MSEPQYLLLVRDELTRDLVEARERRTARARRRATAGARPGRWARFTARPASPAPAAAACCTA
jgi:hypothetical protein